MIYNLDIYDRENDISKYLEFQIGDRFVVVKDCLCGYVGLFDRLFPNYPIMSNSRNEKISNLEIIEKAKGDVLIGGLGIGLIILPLMNSLRVKSIDVVELHDEVIDLVAKKLPLTDKVRIIHDNIYTYMPEKKYDTIYFDTVPYSWNTDKDKEKRGTSESHSDDEELAKVYSAYHLKEGGYCNYFIPKEIGNATL
jgi:hypothetical protein